MNAAMLEYLAADVSVGGTIAMLHATGFCKEVWGPVAEELRAAGVSRSIVAWDQPGHGESPLGSDSVDWWAVGTDSLEVLGGRPEPILGVGHSSGGAGLVMAEITRPGTFDRLLMFEPIIPPPPHQPFEGEFVDMALRRRDEFASPADAEGKLAGRGAFAGWDERALAAYTKGGLVEDGAVWRLRCRPEVESEYYRSAGLHQAWDRLGEVAIPVHLVAGEHSNTHTPEFLEHQAAQFPNSTTEILPGLGHLFPMQDPAATARIIAGHLSIGGNRSDPQD